MANISDSPIDNKNDLFSQIDPLSNSSALKYIQNQPSYDIGLSNPVPVSPLRPDINKKIASKKDTENNTTLDEPVSSSQEGNQQVATDEAKPSKPLSQSTELFYIATPTSKQCHTGPRQIEDEVLRSSISPWRQTCYIFDKDIEDEYTNRYSREKETIANTSVYHDFSPKDGDDLILSSDSSSFLSTNNTGHTCDKSNDISILSSEALSPYLDKSPNKFLLTNDALNQSTFSHYSAQSENVDSSLDECRRHINYLIKENDRLKVLIDSMSMCSSTNSDVFLSSDVSSVDDDHYMGSYRHDDELISPLRTPVVFSTPMPENPTQSRIETSTQTIDEVGPSSVIYSDGFKMTAPTRYLKIEHYTQTEIQNIDKSTETEHLDSLVHGTQTTTVPVKSRGVNTTNNQKTTFSYNSTVMGIGVQTDSDELHSLNEIDCQNDVAISPISFEKISVDKGVCAQNFFCLECDVLQREVDYLRSVLNDIHLKRNSEYLEAQRLLAFRCG